MGVGGDLHRVNQLVHHGQLTTRSFQILGFAGALMTIKTIGVIGAGTMGNGIAHVFARSGFDVILVDVEDRFLQRGLDTITKNLEREVAKDKISADARDAALRRIRTTTSRAALAPADFVVEAATEKFDIKTQIFRDLDSITRPDIILASNT